MIKAGRFFKYEYSQEPVGNNYKYLLSFGLEELLGWIPVQPKNVRTKHIVTQFNDNGENVGKRAYLFSDHRFDAEGRLVQYHSTSVGVNGETQGQDIHVSWQCQEKPVQ